ncbi:Urease accessory protein ureD [Rhynchospora pubera]|uniref:Urease accessory protein ureD n=2 Tax=Rhynchospora pubera TaxID=906938 RepID=A0AAV8HTQ6_9POAL|nr:Urease accessory protein ureD [Rhynchospora pubera]
MAETETETTSGVVTVEKVRGRSTITRCFFKYPLKLILPKKVGSSQVDAVWIYALSYGGGIVSGDQISCKISVGDGCTASFTTQASTKVYKSVDSKCSEQVLEAIIGNEAFLALIPDPVTCFSTARYSQKQNFRIFSCSNLVVVDWITSGRYQSGERWDFTSYKSTNCIYLDNDRPIFIDSVLLEQSLVCDIAERMQCYQVIAMVILLGPKLKNLQNQIKEVVKKMMTVKLRPPTTNFGRYAKSEAQHDRFVPDLIASCSTFGPQGIGSVIRVTATTTEAVYAFLRTHLSSLEMFLGAPPYCQSGI